MKSYFKNFIVILLFVSYSLISFNFYLFYYPGAAAEPLGSARGAQPLGLRGAQVGNLWYSLLLLGYKPVQHVTVLNTVSKCNTTVL